MKTFKQYIEEDGMGGAVVSGPTNTASSGQIASVGQPVNSKFGEPGVGKRKKPVLGYFKRKSL